jgi:replication factor C large subunit
MKTWVEKYRPKKFSEFIGQEEVVRKVRSFVESFPKSRKKAILLYGGPGVGKTTLVYVLANEEDYEIFELNASDFRDKKRLQETLKPSLGQKSLFKKKKLILIDEVDGLFGVDRGGVPELISLIEKSPYPVIATANRVWIKKLSTLRRKVELVELKGFSPSQVKLLLKNVLSNEGKVVPESILNKISINSRGDLRSALNDLESVSGIEGLQEIEIDLRNKEEDIFSVLKYIFQEKADKEMLGAFDKVDLSIDEIILWIEENIPRVYSGVELAKAYQRLANVDLFKGRIYKQQYWRFLVYENIFLSYGIAASKDSEKKGFFKYVKPERILKIWLNNQKHGKKKSIAGKYARATHVATKRVLREWREISSILRNPSVQKELRLDEEEINYLLR